MRFKVLLRNLLGVLALVVSLSSILTSNYVVYTRELEIEQLLPPVTPQHNIRHQQELTRSLQYVHSIESTERSAALQFVHIPKTAGTSIETAAYHSKDSLIWGLCHFRSHPDICPWATPEKASLLRKPLWHLPPSVFPQDASSSPWIIDNNPYQNAEVFAVIRNPYDRLVSEYYWRSSIFGQDKYPLQDSGKLNYWLQKWMIHVFQKKHFSLSCRNATTSLVNVYEDRNPAHPRHRKKPASTTTSGSSRSAKQSVKEDNNNPLVLSVQATMMDALLRYGGHFTSQYEFIVENQIRMIDYVLPMEELNDAFPRLARAFSMDSVKLSGQRINKGLSRQTISTRQEAQEGKSSTDDPVSAAILTPMTIALINSYYEQDFLLGYTTQNVNVPKEQVRKRKGDPCNNNNGITSFWGTNLIQSVTKINPNTSLSNASSSSKRVGFGNVVVAR